MTQSPLVSSLRRKFFYAFVGTNIPLPFVSVTIVPTQKSPPHRGYISKDHTKGSNLTVVFSVYFALFSILYETAHRIIGTAHKFTIRSSTLDYKATASGASLVGCHDGCVLDGVVAAREIAATYEIFI